MIPSPKLQSSAHGRIEKVMLNIPSWVLRYGHQVEIRGTAAAYRAVLTGLREDVRFLLVTHDESRSLLVDLASTLGMSDRAEILTVPDSSKLSVWTEDAFTVCIDESGRRWIMEPLPDKDATSPDPAIAALTREGWGHTFVDRKLQSGNILVGDDFWLLGGDSVGASSSPDELDATKRLHVISSRVKVEGFEEGLGVRDFNKGQDRWTEAHHRGNRSGTVQPMFHIDSLISLAGRGDDGNYRILVGDPDMAAEILGSGLPDHAMKPVFDDIALQLNECGFTVIRNPLPLTFVDNHISKVRHWYFASSNNALVEINGRSKTVWLPSYGHGRWHSLEEIDRANEDIWKQLGFSTQTLTDFHPFAMNLGSLRCMAKCLVR